MGKPLSLPADLVKDWAQRHAKANARLEGIELPEDYVCSEKAQQFLAMRSAQRERADRDVGR